MLKTLLKSVCLLVELINGQIQPRCDVLLSVQKDIMLMIRQARIYVLRVVLVCIDTEITLQSVVCRFVHFPIKLSGMKMLICVFTHAHHLTSHKWTQTEDVC